MPERVIIASEEAHWTGTARVWASVQQFPPKKHSSWWLVLAGMIFTAIAICFVI